jgi:hypothetical protein
VKRTTLLLAALALAPAGCGDGRVPVYPVTGQLFAGGKPAHGAKVFFFPAEEPKDPRAKCPVAEVDEQGNFALTTYDTADGAPAGEYAVCFMWPSIHPLKGTFDGSDRYGSKHFDRANPPYRFSVQKGPNQTPKYELPAPPAKVKREGGPLGG